MQRMLAGHGLRVLQASTAVEGLAIFRAHRASISLAIIDMILPGMSGLDLAAELERLRPGMKILYTSGYGSSVAMESIGRRSPDHVLLKPFTGRLLIDRIAHLLHAERPRHAPTDPIARLTESGFAWDRLMEASEELEGAATELVSYRDTVAGFAVAAAHGAALRAADVPYEFRAAGDEQYPFSLLVLAENVAAAQRLIGYVGLGVDIAVAA